MKCKKCNNEISDKSIFCSFCGKQQAKSRSKKKYDYERVTFYFNNKQYSTTGKTKKEAHAKAATKKFKLENALTATGGNMLVKDWCNEWIETYKKEKVGEAQYRNYMTFINIINSQIGNYKLKDIKDSDLQKIINDKSGKSKSYIAKLRLTMKAIFKKAFKARPQHILYNPAEELILIEAEDTPRRSITVEERKYILELAEKHYAGLWIKTILYCGLRPNETRALDWNHIDFENKRINVENAMKSSTTRIAAPKTKAGIRKIPIPDNLYNDFVKIKKEPDSPVFLKPLSKKRHDERSMQSMWNNFKRELDISMGATLYRNQIIESKVAEDLVPYCLRHTYGTDLQDAGVPINIAKYLMGHSDISVTANIYTHISDMTLNESADKINNHIKNGKNII
jgi:integrase